ncbi:zinc finger homeobox protein 3 isoform X1 [Periophthalmus magnuspinnatus]|uniref:zinc finger homeobox protein 3 isoform X1 n=1 Tax=Periophthalmus magnuspinnatus TaxID=409849 RepID=UPI00145A7672|nr:zinc finger homeobox protein 3 isoform X1 [Periophthalmus magnuspinnatus]
MDSCESPVVSGTDNGLGSSQQQKPPQPWNDHSSSQVPCTNQAPSLDPLSIPSPYSSLGQNSSAPHEGVREQPKQTSPLTQLDSSATGQLGSRREGLEEEEEQEGVSCGEEEDLEDLDEMEIDSCFPSLQPFPGVTMAPRGGGGIPSLLRHQATRHQGAPESGSEGEEEDEEESSDVENLAGEIVYQPDGSAYIVESLSQLIQSGGGMVPGLLPTNSLSSGGKAGEPAGTVYPQIINTFHIASSFGKWFGNSDQGFPNTSTMAGLSPVLHSFRVFDVRHKSNKDYLNSDGSAKKSCVSKDVPNNVDFSKFDGLALYGKGKPILMCFLCKLSFGYARSFATHAVHDHRMTLCEEERRLLGDKHASAIIQGIGKDKEPLISFLEPKNKSTPLPPNLLPINSGQSFYGTFSGVHLEPGSSSAGSEGVLNKDSESGLEQQQQPQTALSSVLSLGGLSVPKASTLTSSPGSAKDSSSLQVGRTEEPGGKELACKGEDGGKEQHESRAHLLSRTGGSEEVEDVLFREEEEEVACGGNSSSGEAGEPAVSNQSISKSPLLMPSSALQPSACTSAVSSTLSSKALASTSSSVKDEGSAADGGGRTSELPLSFNCQGSSGSMATAANAVRRSEDDTAGTPSSPLSSNAAADESANQDSATAPEPNDCPAEGEEENGSLLLHHHMHHHLHASSHSHTHPLTGGPCDLSVLSECSQNHGSGVGGSSGVECPKCDTVLGSSRSLGGHMTMMHSRNSCKTLKCPKCNWHYKYQQTLEAHMKEKHPDSGGSCMYCSSGQSHPRLARGESYTCGYKPFRCEVCNYSTTTKGNLSIHMQSDKHLNNMQSLQNGGSIGSAQEQVFGHAPGGVVAVPSVTQASSHHPPHHHPTQSSSHMGGQCGAPSPTKLKNKPTWRCEVCDYETNVARNLRIHMTSEKHMHNMMLLQQNVTQMQHGRLGLGAMPSPSEAELYQYYLSQNMSLPPGLKIDPAGAEAQFLMGGFHLDPNMAALAPALVGGDIPMDVRLGGGQLVSEELMTLGESLSQTSDPSLKLFQCAVCNRFTTDNLEVLGLHMGAERSLPEEEWRAVVGDSHQCKLCHYTTQLKANFQLHCKTDKHVQKYQLVAHIKEGGKGNEWRLKCVAIGNPVHLKCNACDYYTNSLEKLRMHTVNSRHEASLKLYKHLQQHENAVEGDACYYHCVLCNYSTKAKLNLIQHVRSMKHQRSESLRKLQRLQKGLPEEEDDLSSIFTIRKCPSSDTGELSEDVEAASETTTDQEDQTKERESGGDKELTKGTAVSGPFERRQSESPVLSKRPSSQPETSESPFSTKRPRTAEKSASEQMYQCPYCKFTNTDLNRLRMHVMTQHSVQPMLRCPLCQDMLNNKVHLQFHLTHLHSVAPDCVDKLVSTVTASEALPASMFIPVPSPDRESQSTPHATTNSNCEEIKKQTETSDPDIEKSSSLSAEIVEAQKSPPEDQQSEKDDATGFLCWKKGCNQVFKSSNSLQIHFNEVHNKRPQLPVSDRHVYKYRCNQCSLAFKTVEKLQLHSQYHVIRAATMCCLCQRSFRTLQALKKHLETSHLELSEADIQQLYGGLLMNGDLMVMSELALGEDPSMLGEDDKDGEESDPEEKQSPTGSDTGSLQEDSGSEPKRALPFRKGPNFTMEKFLDPSRPFKCTVCKESFTQKNILLVHYNSVSHLHKVKRALQESTTGQPEPTSSPDNKPFKCSTCNVAYSQSSTLEIHMRSVLHQTKARAAKLEAAGGSTASASNLTSGGSSNSTSTPSPSPASNSTSTSTNHTSSTTHATHSAHGGNHVSQTHGLESLGNSSMSSHSSLSDNHEVKKSKLSDLMSVKGQQQQLQQQQQQLAQAQAQAQAQLQQELQQQAALLQSQLFNPALLQHFPMTTDALLPLQQQQLLFPFYIPGAEFQLNPEISLASSALGLAGSSTSSLLEDLKNSAQQSCLQQQLMHHHLQQQQQQSQQQAQGQMALLQQSASLLQQVESKQKASSSQNDKDRDTQRDKDISDKKEEHANRDSVDNKMKDKKDIQNIALNMNHDPGMLPPRIASDARGNATKALLENFGFELVIQYNENKQKVQKKPVGTTGPSGPGGIIRVVDPVEGLEKLECEVCGKLFSNILILKSHQEHIHQSFFPFRSLERFAKEYREHYDKLYPLRPSTPEPTAAPAPPPPPPPPPPPQRAPTPNIPVSAASLTPPTVPPAQPPVQMAQIPMPMDLPLFSPLMMQPMSLQSLPSQLQTQLPSVEPSLASDLAQLYQQQLTPAMLQAQQNKRPRTRITDDQLRVLRQYFDINNSPNEDQIKEMADKSGLPQKVIKHWFRNTLFKERQRNKDSPYNFNNPPTTTLEDTKVDSKPPSPEPMKQEYYGSKRSSRTRFTDYQLRVLQDFFDANAYPKDDEFEQLSNLLSLPTRVIVVWFQNARQKARKNYENQGEGAKEGERRELTNDRYIRTSNLNYQCKKCSLVFQRIFDLIKHQKKLCYKDEDEDGQYDSHNEDSMELSHDCYTPSGSSCHTPMPSSSSLCPLPPNNSAFSQLTSNEKEATSPATSSNLFDEKPKQLPEISSDPRENQTTIKQEVVHQPQPETQHRSQRDEKIQNLSKTLKRSSPSFSQQQAQCGPSGSQTSQAPSQSSHMGLNPHLTSASQQLAQHIIPYQCEQCKIAFPSFEHWQEHQQLHFLSVQNQFIHPQFLDRPIDMPFMLFDPSNPLLASQLLSGAMPQIPSSSATSPSTPTSTMNSLKRKLEEKAGTSPGENDSTNSGEEPQRDKRLRTTITPEQLEILYQKYLLDSNPTRKMLDHIAHEVGLKKRVVQVWFQNTRARERKGQFRAVGPAQAHRRCPFCRALFKAKTALEAHIRSRHWHEAKRAGYNLALSAMLPDQDGMPKMDALDPSTFSQLLSANNDVQGASMSPVNKGLDLSPRALLSPSSIKVEGMEDYENATMSSVNLSFDQSKLDNDDCSSVNTAITDTTTGDEANADNDSADAKHSQSGSDYLSKSGGTVPLLENDDHMSSGLVSPASYYAKDYENENMIDHSETSSLADPCSPSPGASGSRSLDGSDRPGQKRFRTQMTNLQLKVLKSCFNDYRTPTMLECEVLGNDIGLPKRVVQVWFQNARAKEKKAKLNMAKHFGINQTSYEGPKTECTLCGVKYSARLSVRDHIFSQQHIAKVKDTIGSQIDKEKEYFDPATVRQLMAQQEMDRIKKANEVLGLAQQQAMQQQGMFDNPAMQALNLQSAYPNLQGIPPVLLPGVGSPSLSSFNSSNSALTPPKPSNLLNMPGASVPSPSLPTSGLPNKPPSSTSLTSPSPAQTSTSVSHSSSTTTSSSSSTQSMSRADHPKERDAERQREKEKSKEKPEKSQTPSSTGSTPAPSTSAASAKKDKPDTAVPATSMPTPGMEYVVDPAQLQALQAALATDPTALLTNQFLPYFMPGFSPYYTPQIPGALQGGYLQPMYGMESLFPYNPSLSQALMGLSPGSLLQHYQQYQQSLQEALQQQQRQLQQIQQPKTSQTPNNSQIMGKDSAKEPVKNEEQKSGEPQSTSSSGSHNKAPSEQNEVDGKAVEPHLDQFIVPKVHYKLACRKCQAVFSKEEAAVAHIKSNCFFGQAVSNLQEMLLRVPGGTGSGGGSLYDCLACETTLDGEKALSQHLESALHKHRTIKRSVRNAKEHVTSLLPHSSACFPSPNTASTSQSATHPISSPPPTTSAAMSTSPVSSSLCSSSSSTSPVNTTAAGKAWPQVPFNRALAGKPNASPSSSSFPPVSSPSTVTSSSLSTSGVQTSIPTDVFSDESDSDSSQKSLDRLGRPAEEPQQPTFVKDSNSCSSTLTSVGTDSIRL